jgi:hypothetical protein
MSTSLPVRAASLLLALAAAALGACASDDDCRGIACGPTGPPVEVIVRGVPDATVACTRADGVTVDVSCSSGDPDTYCSCDTADRSEAGTYLVHVEAAGYEPADREVVVDATLPGGCCNPGYLGQTVTIDLEPAP